MTPAYVLDPDELRRIVREELRAALSLPPDAPDEYLRGYEDGVVATIKEYDLAPPPAPAPGARCERCGLCGGKGTVSMATAERPDLRRVCPACGGSGKGAG